MTGARLAVLILSRAETVEEEEAVEDAVVAVEAAVVEDAVVVAAAAKALIDFVVWDTFALAGGVLGSVTLGDFIGDRSCGGRPGKRGSFSSFFFFGSNFGTVDRAACKDCLE